MKDRARILSIRLMTIITFVLFMSRGVIQPVNSLYVEFLGATYVAIGLLGTITSLTSILFSYVWGWASDYVGQRKVFLAPSLAVMALSYGLIAVAPSYGYLFPLNILGAAAQAAFSTASLALMGDLLEEGGTRRGRRMGVYRGLGSLGFGLVAFLSGSIADRFSIRTPYYFSAAFLVIAFALALVIKEPEGSGESTRVVSRGDGAGNGGPLRSALASTWASVKAAFAPLPDADDVVTTPRLPLQPLLIAAFLWSLTTGAVYAVWANYMVSELGYSQAVMSRLWALASTTEFPLMILAGWLSDRMGRLPMLSLGFVAWAVVFSGYVYFPGMPWIILIQLTRGFAYSAFTATAMTYATEVRPKQRGQVSGLYSSANGLGSILGSSLGGTLTQLTGFRTMIGTNAVVIFGGAVYLAVVAFRHIRQGRKWAG